MTSPVSCCLLLMLLGWIKQTCAGGTVTIRFVSYANPTHKDDEGQCCESLSSSGCGANECDPFFKICVGAPGRPGCDFGQVKTEVHDNTDNVQFRNVIRSMANPIVKSFNNWGSGIHVRVDVLDRDAGTFSGGDDLIGTVNYDITGPVDQNGTSTQQTSRTIRGGAVVIVVEYSVVCVANYYGDCSVYCRPVSSRYHCSSTGQKICLSGWVGPQCDNRVSPCAKNPCRNGGSCTDMPTDDFRCTCLRGWTGKQCEAFVLPQNPNTTPKPSTSMTSPSHTTLTSSLSSSTQKLVTSASQGSMVYTSSTGSTTSTQKMGTSTSQGSISFTTQNGSTAMPPKVGMATTHNAVISTTEEITSSNQHSISSTQSQGRTPDTAVVSTDSTTDMLSTLAQTTSHQNIASCQINVAANVINVTNVTQVQVSGFNQLRLNVLNVKRILGEKAKTVILRTVSVNDTVMVFEMETIDNTSSTSSSLLPSIQKELCQIQTKTPGSSDGRSSSYDSEEGSNNTGPVIGGVLGALVIVAIGGIVAFFLYRWKKGKRTQVMDNSKDDILQSSCDVHNEIISGNMNMSPPPASTQVM